MNRKQMRPMMRMLKDESGSLPVLYAMMLAPMIGFTALAVDYSRALKAQERLQTVLDGAILAAMKDPSSPLSEKQQIAAAFFEGNFVNTGKLKGNGQNSIVVTQAPTFVVNEADGTMTAEAKIKVRAPFGQFVSLPYVEMAAKAVVAAETGSGQKLEIGMMIDLTGSMGATRNGSTKIAGLKTAAADLLNILYPTGDNPNLRVAIAPMADYVNAGEFANEVTGLSSTGSYAKSSNLTNTKQGPFSGSYSGYYGNSQPTGSQFGATSSSGSGATYTSTFCTAGNEYETYGYGNKPVGTKAYSSTPGAVWVSGTWYRKYWNDGRWKYESEDNDWVVRTRSSTCTEAADQSGQLVSCVTERTNATTRYTDDAVSAGNFVGPYNQSASGTTNKLNYSADGKCYVGGRELPAVIPLTSSKSTLESFFTNASVGGATPGHIGHAWAWYTISPKWSSIWPAASKPADYTDTGTRKVAIIMTDGEYNTQYSSATSKAQALALCQGMKDANITVYTIGFGFSNSATAGDGSSEGNIKQMLTQCSSGTNHYYFPYDSAALRSVFQEIGNGLMGENTQISKLKLKE
ncbi:MAG: pilus assembly protein [Hyphomicrobium sp.]